MTTVIRVSLRLETQQQTGDRLTNFLTLYDTLFNGTSKAVSGLFLVAIVSCAVEEAISYRECGFDSLFKKIIGLKSTQNVFIALTSAQVARST